MKKFEFRNGTLRVSDPKVIKQLDDLMGEEILEKERERDSLPETNADFNPYPGDLSAEG